MSKLIKANNFGVNFIDLSFSFPCDIHHCYIREIIQNDSFKVLLHASEPSTLKWQASEVLKYHNYFDLILTSDKSLLMLPNAVFFIFGDCWVKDYICNDKEFSVSYLHSTGIDQNWDGYNFRKEIWKNRRELNNLIRSRFWYSSRRPPVDDIEDEDQEFKFENKDIIFNSMFSICIENIRENDYFTEKIIDALSTKTVPIYYGCPNIGDYFDSNGIITINSIDELKIVISSLSEELYYSKIQYIENNKIYSECFKNGFKNIQKLINHVYNNNLFDRSRGAYITKNKSLSPNALIRSYYSSVGVEIAEATRIDKQCSIGNYTYIGSNVGITRASIGNYCSIANNVNIGQGEHDLKQISTNSIFYKNAWSTLTSGEVIIEDDVWIGVGVTILRGVSVGTGAVIGANAVVTTNIPPYAIAVGVPARVIKYRFTPDKIDAILKTKWWTKDPIFAEEIFESLVE